MNCNAYIDCFGAAREQKRPDGSVLPVAYISRATLDCERHQTPLDLEVGILWAIKRLRGCLWDTQSSAYFQIKRQRRPSAKWGTTTHVYRWIDFLTAFDYTLDYRKGSANRSVDFVPRSPAVDQFSHRAGLHTRVRQGQRQRKCRFRIPLARACHRTGPQ